MENTDKDKDKDNDKDDRDSDKNKEKQSKSINKIVKKTLCLSLSDGGKVKIKNKISDLSKKILADILSYLPIDELVKCERVSKLWQSCVIHILSTIRTFTTRMKYHQNYNLDKEWKDWIEYNGYAPRAVDISCVLKDKATGLLILNQNNTEKLINLFVKCRDIQCLDFYRVDVIKIDYLTLLGDLCSDLQALYIYQVSDMNLNKWKEFIEEICTKLNIFHVYYLNPNMWTYDYFKIIELLMEKSIYLEEFGYQSVMPLIRENYRNQAIPTLITLAANIRKLKISVDSFPDLVAINSQDAKQVHELWLDVLGGELQPVANKFINLKKLHLYICIHDVSHFFDYYLDKWAFMTKSTTRDLMFLDHICIYFYGYSNKDHDPDVIAIRNKINYYILNNLPLSITTFELHNSYLDSMGLQLIVNKPFLENVIFHNVNPIFYVEKHIVESDVHFRHFWMQIFKIKYLKTIVLKDNIVKKIYEIDQNLFKTMKSHCETKNIQLIYD